MALAICLQDSRLHDRLDTYVYNVSQALGLGCVLHSPCRGTVVSRPSLLFQSAQNIEDGACVQAAAPSQIKGRPTRSEWSKTRKMQLTLNVFCNVSDAKGRLQRNGSLSPCVNKLLSPLPPPHKRGGDVFMASEAYLLHPFTPQ